MKKRFAALVVGLLTLFLNQGFLAWAQQAAPPIEERTVIEENILVAENILNIKDLKVSATTYSSFSVKAGFAGDANGDARCRLYYCNHTQDTKCVPQKSQSIAMAKDASAFTATVKHLNDPSDQFFIEMLCEDADGVKAGRTKGNLVLGADPQFVSPLWKNSVVGYVEYGMGRNLWLVNDQRSSADTSYYSINREGKISGDEILQAAQIANFSQFREQVLARNNPIQALLESNSPAVSMGPIANPTAAQPSLQEMKDKYQIYLKARLDRAFSGLALGRILDNEAMKRKMAPTVSKVRYEYVLNYIFNKNAVEKGHAPADRPTDNDYPTLFQWLKETVQTEGFYSVVLDWKQQPWVSSLDQKLLYNKGESDWPTITLNLSASGFPETVEDFQNYMLMKLDEMYRSVLRIDVWQMLRHERRMGSEWNAASQISKEDLQKYYVELADKLFKTRSTLLSTWEITASGVLKQQFMDRFYQLFGEREMGLLGKINATSDKAESEKIISEARSGAPYDVYAKAKAEFADAIKAKKLSLQFMPTYLSHNGTSPIGKVSQDEYEKLSFLFNDKTLDEMMKRQVFPRYEAVLKDGSYQVVFVSSLKRGDAFNVPFENATVQNVLKKYATEKMQGKILRDLTYQLFLQNPVRVARDTCDGNAYWQCVTNDPVQMTESLFPEVPFKAADMKGKTNTIKEPTLFKNIMTIGSDPFMEAMQFPNFKDRDPRKFKFSDEVRGKRFSGVQLKGFTLEY